jgi:cytidine deaminase
MADPLGPEDAKLVTLARAARSRVGAAMGAALRDETGRSYSGANVELKSLALSGLQLAVAQAVASGARGVEAAVVVGSIPGEGLDALRELAGPGVPLFLCDASGVVIDRILT